MSSDVLSIRFNKEELALVESLAKLYGVATSKVVKNAALEKAENELDYEMAARASQEHRKNPNDYTVDDFRREFLN
jgi:uncharacterized protein (DUF1778 family)